MDQFKQISDGFDSDGDDNYDDYDDLDDDDDDDFRSHENFKQRSEAINFYDNARRDKEKAAATFLLRNEQKPSNAQK